MLFFRVPGLPISLLNQLHRHASSCVDRRAMLQGKSTPLLSSFRLSYYTLLNLIRRIEGSGEQLQRVACDQQVCCCLPRCCPASGDPNSQLRHTSSTISTDGQRAGYDMEYVISKSFSQFQHEQQLPELESRLKAAEAGACLLLGFWQAVGPLLCVCWQAAAGVGAEVPDAPGSGRSSLSSNSSSTSSSDDVAPQQPALLPRSPLLAEAAQISAATDAAAAEYTEGRQQLAAAAAVVRQAMQLPQHCLHFLRPGRIVRVTEGGLNSCLAS